MEGKNLPGKETVPKQVFCVLIGGAIDPIVTLYDSANQAVPDCNCSAGLKAACESGVPSEVECSCRYTPYHLQSFQIAVTKKIKFPRNIVHILLYPEIAVFCGIWRQKTKTLHKYQL